MSRNFNDLAGVELYGSILGQLNRLELSAAFELRVKKSKEKKAKEDDKGKKEELIKDKGCTNRRRRKAECQKLYEKIEALGGKIAQLQKVIEKLDDDSKAVKADRAKFKDRIEKLTDLRAKKQSLVTATDLISAKLNIPDDATRITALAQLIRAERLHGILKSDGAYTLRVGTDSGR